MWDAIYCPKFVHVCLANQTSATETTEIASRPDRRRRRVSLMVLNGTAMLLANQITDSKILYKTINCHYKFANTFINYY